MAVALHALDAFLLLGVAAGPAPSWASLMLCSLKHGVTIEIVFIGVCREVRRQSCPASGDTARAVNSSSGRLQTAVAGQRSG